MKILVTGSAGFIGQALSLRLLARGDEVIGVDNLNDYYDVTLKQARLDALLSKPGYTDYRANLEDANAINEIFRKHKPQ
ncbi:MAG: GDP-mannose 4,6-dehydratase, partial [Pseudomonadota bacterium]|nr:GDP-mannose 4,6-dehydratase [Pseudomonadota bacterium]